MTLTIERIEKAKPGINASGRRTRSAYKIGDCGGLYLLVTPSGSKYWRFNYRIAQKRRTIALGVYPKIPLPVARQRRDEYRELLANGMDPGEQHKMAKAARRGEEVRQIVATRFMIANDGALSFRFGNRSVSLNPAETVELRAFLEKTRSVAPKVTPCP